MTWRGVEKKMNWVNREFLHHLLNSDPDDERWTLAAGQWADAYVALRMLEKLCDEAEQNEANA